MKRLKPVSTAVLVALVSSYHVNAETMGSITAKTKSAQPTAQGLVTAENVYNVGEVSRGTASSMQNDVPSNKSIFKSGYATRVIGKSELKSIGPAGGVAQALTLSPGVNISGGYGNTGATKYQISINGVTTGWQSYSGASSNNGSIMVTFNGIPMNDPATGLWQTPQVNQLNILNGIQVTYGPGSVAKRYYDNIGGAINFEPLEPTKKAGGKISATYGSYNDKGIQFSLDTGEYDGWAAVLAGGASSSNSYIVGSDGFAHPSSDYSYYAKIVKKFKGGRVSIGGLYSRAASYRPDPIPVNPVAGLSLTSANAPAGAQLYSQQTTGYYTTVPEQYNDKIDTNRAYLIYGKLHLHLDKYLKLEDDLWYRSGSRTHYKTVTPFSSAYENENPFEHNYGDKVTLSTDNLPLNTVKFGGYFENSLYFTNEEPDLQEFPNNHYRGNYFNQTNLALFLQDTFRPISNFRITPGIRIVNYQTYYDFATPSIYPAAYAANPNDAQGNLHISSQDSFTKLEGALSANWTPVHWLALFASWGNSYRQPPLGGGGGPYQAIEPGNFSLEAATEYQAGIKMHFRNLSLLHHFIFNANWYFLRWSNKYVPYSITVNGQSEDISAFGSTNYQGINIFADDDLYDNLHMFLNASFETAKYITYSTNGASYSGLPAPYVPSSLINIGLSYKDILFGNLVNIRGWYSHVGSQYMFNNNTGTPSTLTMPTYGTLNASLGLDVPFRHSGIAIKKLGFHLTLDNILNTHYNNFEEISSGGTYNTNSSGYLLGSPGAPFTIYGSVSASF